MARPTGTWLTGLGSAGVPGPSDRGVRLGLPPVGPGSVAPFGARAMAFLVDIALSALMGGLVNVVVADPTDVQRNLAGYAAFGLLTVLSLTVAGQTPGMRLNGLRVLPLRSDRPTPSLPAAIARPVVLATLVLALVMDRDGRGLHDKIAQTVVVTV